MALRPGGLRSHHSGLRIRGRRRSETTAGARCFLVGNASVSCAGYWSDVADVVVVLERLSTATIGRYLHARPAAEQAAASRSVLRTRERLPSRSRPVTAEYSHGRALPRRGPYAGCPGRRTVMAIRARRSGPCQRTKGRPARPVSAARRQVDPSRFAPEGRRASVPAQGFV